MDWPQANLFICFVFAIRLLEGFLGTQKISVNNQ